MASRFPAPYSSSREMRGMDPLMELHREMDRLFDNVFGTGGALSAGTAPSGFISAPRIDVHESEREVCISAELPGVQPSEVDLRVEGDTLTISGEKKSQTDRTQENFHVMERGYGRFQRSIQLPFAPDPEQVRAECHHGVLMVHLPKQAQQERSRRIQIRDAGHAEEGQGAPVGTASDKGPEGGRNEGGPITH